MEELIEKIKEYKIIVICASLGLVLGGFFLLKPVAQTPAKESNLQTEVTTVSKDSTEEKEDKNQKEEVVEQDLITVDVKGAVKLPGIYDLPVGSRINDAVQKAGGLTDNADSKSINLAQRIVTKHLFMFRLRKKLPVKRRIQMLPTPKKIRKSILIKPV